MPFADILGQHKAHRYLQMLVRSQRVPGALLFYGPEGVGKAKTALEFAKALNCQDPQARQNGDACGVCASCRAVARGTHPDVTFVDFVYQARLEIKKDFSSKGYEEELEKEIAKQQHLSVDTVRQVTAKSQQKAAGPGWKVLIIDQAQTMQGAASNALLKFIEEPPQKTVWVLITSRRASMLRTILSRCQAVPFAPLAPGQIQQIFTQTGAQPQYPELCAAYGGGSVSGALQADAALALLAAGDFGPAGVTPQAPGAVAAQLSRTLVTARQEAACVLNVLSTALYRMWQTAPDETSRRRYQQILQQFTNYKRNLSRHVSPALVLETALMSLDGVKLSVF